MLRKTSKKRVKQMKYFYYNLAGFRYTLNKDCSEIFILVQTHVKSL